MIFDALFEPRQLSTSNARNPGQWLIDWFNGGSDTAAGIPVSQRSALTYSAVWAATRILSEGVASVPCVLYRRRLQREGKDKARDHVLYRVLHDEPNSEMDSCTFFDQQTPFLVNSGNAYAEKERMLSGRIAGLWPLKSHDVNPVRREDGQIEYEVTRDQGGQDIVVAKNMLHVTGVLSEDGITGKGVIKQGRESIAMGQATEKYGAGFFGKDCRPGGVLTTEQSLGDRAWARMQSWSKEHGGFAKAHKLGVLEEGTKYQAIGVSPEAAQFLATRQHNITELARWYRVPLHMLAIVLGVPRANIEEEGINLVTYSLRPWWVRYERAYHRQLLTEEEKPQLFVGFNGDALLRGDSKSRTESYKNKFGVGGITVNRILGLEDENEIGPEGDRRFVPMNMIPLDRVDDYVDALMKKAAARNSPSKRGPGDGGDQDKPGDAEKNAADVLELTESVVEVVQTTADVSEAAAELRHRETLDTLAVQGVRTERRFDKVMAGQKTLRAGGLEDRDALANTVCDVGASLDARIAMLKKSVEPVAASVAQHDEAERHRNLAKTWRAVEERFAPLAAIGIKEALKAAKTPRTFLAKIDAFHAKYATMITEAIQPSVDAWLGVGNDARNAGDVASAVADAHVAESRKQLLKACECKPEDLVGRVAECVGKWDQRRPCLPEIEEIKTAGGVEK